MAITKLSTNGIYGDKYADFAANNNNWYEAIATTVVGGTNVSEVVFSNIPSDYTHLQIRCIMKSTSSTLTKLQLNGNTASNYSYHQVYGDGSSVGSAGGANQSDIFYGQTSATNLVMGAAIIDILDYKDTSKFKTIRSLMGMDANGSGTARLFSGNWRNTNAVTSIRFFPDGGSWTQYTRFSLYGLRG